MLPLSYQQDWRFKCLSVICITDPASPKHHGVVLPVPSVLLCRSVTRRPLVIQKLPQENKYLIILLT